MNNRTRSGQSLIEVVIGIAIGVLFIAGALAILTVTLKLDLQNKYGQISTELAQQIAEQTASLANSNWHAIDADTLTHGTSTLYHIEDQNGFFAVANNTTTTILNGQSYTQFFTIEDVQRNDLGEIVTSSGTTDPSTLKINATVQWTDKGDTNESVFSRYLTRNRDRGAVQKDWSGGSLTSEIPLTNFGNQFSTSTGITFSNPGELIINSLATTTPAGPYSNIDATSPNYYAWNDVVGWINFRSTNTVHVSSTQITGFAYSNAIGYIALNCNSTPPNSTDVCPPTGPSQFSVLNDGSGNLSGFAWNDAIGWISFKDTINTTPIYQVTIDQNTGEMHGFAWNDAIGWISFNCADIPAGCSSPGIAYRVKVNSGTPVEATLISLIYSTEQSLGAAFNALIWQGSQPAGTSVRFQIATDCLPAQGTAPICTGGYDGWNFVGPDGTRFTYFQSAGPGTSIMIPRDPNHGSHNNKRYVRFKAFLASDTDMIVTPTINTITINWSL